MGVASLGGSVRTGPCEAGRQTDGSPWDPSFASFKPCGPAAQSPVKSPVCSPGCWVLASPNFVSTVQSHHPWRQSPSVWHVDLGWHCTPVSAARLRVAPGPRSEEAQDEEPGHVMWDPRVWNNGKEGQPREHVSPKLGVDGVLQGGEAPGAHWRQRQCLIQETW